METQFRRRWPACQPGAQALAVEAVVVGDAVPPSKPLLLETQFRKRRPVLQPGAQALAVEAEVVGDAVQEMQARSSSRSPGAQRRT